MKHKILLAAALSMLTATATARDYGQAAEILHDLGVGRIRLVSSNPAKERALTARIARLPQTETGRRRR